MKNVKFRLVGVPPDVAGQLVDIDFDQDIESAKSEVKRIYELNPILDVQFIFKGKVITELSQLKKRGFNPKKDMITIMATQSAGAYNIRNRDLLNHIISEGYDQKGRKTFLLAFRGIELNSPLEILKKFGIEEIQNYELATLLRGIDPTLQFSLSIADHYSKLSKSKTPDGRVLLEQNLINDFKADLLENIESLTKKSPQELQSISPQAFNGIKNYFENSIYKKNKDFAEKYLKGGFFNMLLTYYLKYELPTQIWASFVESDPSIKNKFRDKYFQTWDTDAKKLQKIIWGVLLDFRNPYDGERIQDKDGNPDFRTWMSGKIELHHWLTAEGVENKYKCFFLASLPLPKRKISDSSFFHNKVTKSISLLKGDAKIREGKFWQDEFAVRLSDLLTGIFPSDWNQNFKDDFDDYRINPQNIDARELISWFFLSSQKDLMRKAGINIQLF